MLEQRFFPHGARPSSFHRSPAAARLPAIAVAVALMCVAPALAAAPMSEPASPATATDLRPSAVVSGEETCDDASSSADELVRRSLAAGLDPSRVDRATEADANVPNCPIRSCRCSSCQRPIFCPVGGGCVNQNTGLKACSLDGIVIRCRGNETIHLLNGPCELPAGQSCGPLNFCGSATITGSCR